MGRGLRAPLCEHLEHRLRITDLPKDRGAVSDCHPEAQVQVHRASFGVRHEGAGPPSLPIVGAECMAEQEAGDAPVAVVAADGDLLDVAFAGVREVQRDHCAHQLALSERQH